MRKLLLETVFLVAVHGICIADSNTQALPADYQRALLLIHTFSGAGNELDVAMELAEKLSTSHPGQGYSETLKAEALSTWQLDQRGSPTSVRIHVITLADQALRLNPKLAQAHVARARAQVRASEYGEAYRSVDAALKLDPSLSGAMFMRAEIFRRTGMVAEAETWYGKFIDATADQRRKSNGYYWLAKTYQDAFSRDPSQRSVLLPKARTAFESMLKLDPDGAWGNVNYAVFLNSEAVDFGAAERYAQKALSIMDFPMARYHLAIARYQKLSLGDLRASELREAIRQVHESTGISLEDAVEFVGPCLGMKARLQSVQARVLNDAAFISADSQRYLNTGCRG
jgi:tetratricopeptide (TPR) repeat protein